MNAFAERLTRGTCLILDGGLGTRLMARGLPPGTPPERWNLDRPEEIEAVARAYVEAGSEAIHANTFGANPVRLAPFGLAARCEELNLEGVRLARTAKPGFVIGDVGPTGEHLPPVGKGSLEVWRDAYLRQGRALARAGVDAVHIETMSDLREARVALEALLETVGDLPVMVSLTFDRKRRGFFTIFGDRPVQGLSSLLEAGAAAVGANCSLASPDMRDLATELLEGLTCPLIIQPNAGRPEPGAEGVCYLQRPEEFADDMAELIRAGIAAAGGCCGTDPAFIRALRARLEVDGR
jgi:methionine synthase I (cobalamin-dependent)